MNIPLKQYWLLLRTYLRPQHAQVLLLALLIFGHIALQLLNPQIMRYFIDTAVAGGPVETLVRAGILFLSVALVAQLLSIGNAYLGETVAWRATNALRLDLVLHCLRLDQSFHKRHSAGELLERIDGDVNTLSNFFSRLVIHVVGNLLLIIGVLMLLLVEDWRIGLGVSAFAGLALYVMIRVRALATPQWAKVRQISAEFYGFLSEHLNGLEDIRANGATRYVVRRFDEIMQRWFPLRRNAIMVSSITWTSNIGLPAAGTAVAFGLSAYLWRQNQITIGTVYLISYYTNLLRHPMRQLRNQIEDLQRADASIGRVRDMLQTESALRDGTGGRLSPGPIAVTFDSISFSYDDELVLQDVSFHLPPGRVLGLLGRTGSGKSTIARLLLRFYDPDEGTICLDGMPAYDLPLSHLRRHIGMVTQEVQLFRASIRDNLTFFNPHISDEELLTVLEALGLDTWLASQPDGLATVLSGRGSNLSAGQAQLLAFARVFLSDPGLVILDEASSRVDPATEQLLERAVDRLLHNRTGIIIAHRLTTVQRADDILILEDGCVAEFGERVRLAQTPGSRFHHLLQTGLQEVLA